MRKHVSPKKSKCGLQLSALDSCTLQLIGGVPWMDLIYQNNHSSNLIILMACRLAGALWLHCFRVS